MLRHEALVAQQNVFIASAMGIKKRNGHGFEVVDFTPYLSDEQEVATKDDIMGIFKGIGAKVKK